MRYLNQKSQQEVSISYHHGLLTSSSALSFFKVDQLKEILKVMRADYPSISLTGKKADLISRIEYYLFSNPRDLPQKSTAGSSSSSSMFSFNPPSRTSSPLVNKFIPVQLNLQREKTKEEATFLELISRDKSLEGKVDPHHRIERFVDVKILHNAAANLSFDFTITEEEKQKLKGAYQIHVHFFANDMKPKNWQNDFALLVNGMRIEAPPLNRKLAKGMKKPVLIVSSPFILKDPQIQVGSNRLEVRASHYSLIDGRILIAFTRILETGELVTEVSSRSPNGHNLDIDIGNGDQDNKMKYVPIDSREEKLTFDNLINIPAGSRLEFTELQKISQMLDSIEKGTPITHNDSIIEELGTGDEVVPLKDPLSLCRIQMPAKGKKCVHKACFDLVGFLEFGKSSKTYNCPRCDKPTPFNDLLVDPLMQRILKEVGENVEKVLVKEDGSFTIVEDTPKKRVSSTPAIVTTDLIQDDEEESNSSKSPSWLTSFNMAPSPTPSIPPPTLSFMNMGIANVGMTSENGIKRNSTSKTSGSTIDDAIELD